MVATMATELLHHAETNDDWTRPGMYADANRPLGAASAVQEIIYDLIKNKVHCALCKLPYVK